MRDDFPQIVKETLAKRVGYRCSNPGCRQPTSGPHEEPQKFVNIGVAAHITAAAAGGKRYYSNLSSDERKSISNGIWLCQNCGKLIDSNEQKYSVEVLLAWKHEAERQASLEVENGNLQGSNYSSSRFEQYLQNLVDDPRPRWLGAINDLTWYEFELFTKVQEKSKKSEEKSEGSLKQQPLLKAVHDAKKHAILITGEPGSGKSAFLEKLAVEAARKAQNDCDAPIPVLVRLKDYEATGEDAGIRGLIQAALRSYDPSLNSEALDQLLQSRKILLLMDGWNELSDGKAKEKIKKFCKPHSVIVTDRNGENYWEIQQKFEIQPLLRNDVQRFFHKQLPNIERKPLQELVNRVHDFGQTPLMAWMLFSVFCDDGSIPKTRGQAYRLFTAAYGKKAKAGIDLSDARKLLGKVAFEMMRSPNSKYPKDFRLKISEVEAEHILGSEAELERMLNHLLRQQGKLGNREISFCHQSLQEYYAAEHLIQELDQHSEWLEKQSGREYSWFQHHYLNYTKWTEVIAIALSLMTSKEQAMEVVRAALEVDLMLGARLAGKVQADFQEETCASLTEEIRRQQVSQTYEIVLLGSTRSEYVASVLIEKLTDQKNQNLIIKSAFALEELGVRSIVEKLLPLLQHDNQLIVTMAIFVLGKLGNEEIITDLRQQLRHPDANIRAQTIEALGELGNDIVLPDLHQALKEKEQSIQVCEKAVEVLGQLCDESILQELIKIAVEPHAISAEAISLRWSSAKALGRIDPEKATEELFKVLNNEENYEVRRNAAEALGKVGSETAIEGLIAALENHRADWSAAEALVEIGSKKAVPGLIKALKYPVPCEQAAFVLGEIGDELVVPALIDALSHWYPNVRKEVIEALGKIGDKSATSALYKLYKTLRDNLGNELKVEVVIALGRLGDERVQQDLITVLNDPTLSSTLYKCHWKVFKSLERIGGHSVSLALVQVLLKSENPEYRWKAAEVLGNLGCEMSIDSLLIALTDKKSTVRWKAAEAIGSFDSSKVIPKLLSMLKQQEDLDVREAVIHALGYMKDEAAVAALLEVLSTPEDDLEPPIYYYAVQSLAKLSASAELKTDISKVLGHPWKNKLLNDGFIYQMQSIKENCKLYNYEIAHAAAEKVKSGKGERGGGEKDAKYNINAEVVQIIEKNDGIAIGQFLPETE